MEDIDQLFIRLVEVCTASGPWCVYNAPQKSSPAVMEFGLDIVPHRCITKKGDNEHRQPNVRY